MFLFLINSYKIVFYFKKFKEILFKIILNRYLGNIVSLFLYLLYISCFKIRDVVMVFNILLLNRKWCTLYV